MAGTPDRQVNHIFDPIYDSHSKILILGTMPSVSSRNANFYYMHPQNLFWRLLSDILEYTFPTTMEDKRKMLLESSIAVWDVLESCEIEGSSDSSIKNPVPNDLTGILNSSGIKTIYTNGSKATSLYKKFCSKSTGIQSIPLPSTSPANRKYFSYDRMLQEWRAILEWLSRRDG